LLPETVSVVDNAMRLALPPPLHLGWRCCELQAVEAYEWRMALTL
jgi:hypothetical protein